jgi:hypothetical protein
MPVAGSTKDSAKKLVCRVYTYIPTDPLLFRSTEVYAVPILRTYVIYPDPSHISEVKVEELEPVYGLVYEDQDQSQPPSPLERIADISTTQLFDQRTQPRQENAETGCLSVCLTALAIPALSIGILYSYFLLTN